MIYLINKEYSNYFVSQNIDLDSANRYYDYFLENIKTLVNSGAKYQYIKPQNIEIDCKIENNYNDKFLCSGYLNLGNDIENKGTYFPLMIEIVNGKYKIREGLHRIHGLKLINSQKSFLSFIYSANTIDICSNSPIEIYILQPTCFIENFLRINGNYKNIKKVEKDIYKITINKIFDATCFTFLMGCYLGRIFYNHKENIIPSLVINNKSEFEKWITN